MLDGSDTGQSVDTSDEGLAAKQGITMEQVKDAQAKLLAKVYALILSWPHPTSKSDNPDETT